MLKRYLIFTYTREGGDPLDSRHTIKPKNMNMLANLLRNPNEFFKDERRLRILIGSLFAIVFACIITLIIRTAVRGKSAADTVSTVTPVGTPTSINVPVSTTPANTPTAWWLQPIASPISSNAAPQGVSVIAGDCFPYTSQSEITAGTYAYISLLPPYENLIRSGAGKDHPIVGNVDVGNWIRVVENPIICKDGYVWILVESEGNPRGWTAGGHNSIQWVTACPDKNQKCSYKPSSDIASTQPKFSSDNSSTNQCKSDRLMAGIEAQVNPDALLVIRNGPNAESIIGRASPASIVMVLNGPECAGEAVWWSIFSDDAQLAGWSVETDLRACPKEGECTPWDS